MNSALNKPTGGRLQTKILIGLGVFLLALVSVLASSAYLLIRQHDAVTAAVYTASHRVDAATAAELRILEMDRAIQALIAADESGAIREAAIASIRAGAALDENLAALQTSFESQGEVEALIASVNELRPAQMRIIGAGRKNSDEKALEMTVNLRGDFEATAALARRLVDDSRAALLTSLDDTKSETLLFVELLAAGCAVFALVGTFVAVIGARLMSRPLAAIEKTMKAMSTGDLSNELDIKVRGRDEIARTVEAIRETIGKLRGMLERVSETTREVSDEARAVSAGAGAIDTVTGDLDKSVGAIGQGTEKVLDTVESAAGKAESAYQSALAASEAATGSAQHVLATVESFSRFQQEMEATVAESRELAEVAERITSITHTISAISEQTNLLALNAAIEAARAGEQGRGFAVVAEEVRGLAQRSSEAVDEISTLTASITGSVEKTVRSIEKARDDIDGNVTGLKSAAEKGGASSEQAHDISRAMRELVDLTEVQRTAMRDIAGTVARLTEVSQDTRSQVEALHQRSGNLDRAASSLQSVVSQFKL